MVDRLISPVLGAVFVAALLLQGCAPMASDMGGSAGLSDPRVQTVRMGSGSSLEALRRGEEGADGPLKNIYFDFDRYDLKSESREALKTNAAWLKEHASTQVEIEGHCDARGTTEYNLALGAKRAQAAKDFLVTLGIPAGRITTISYGKEVPLCRDATEACWQKNRRDRFVVIPAGPSS